MERIKEKRRCLWRRSYEVQRSDGAAQEWSEQSIRNFLGKVPDRLGSEWQQTDIRSEPRMFLWDTEKSKLEGEMNAANESEILTKEKTIKFGEYFESWDDLKVAKAWKMAETKKTINYIMKWSETSTVFRSEDTARSRRECWFKQTQFELTTWR